MTNNDSHYVSLPHETEYSLKLQNLRESKCDAEVTIDGEVVGTWRLNAFESSTIERPTHTARHFTFVREGTSEAARGKIKSGGEKNGVISVKFTPEIDYHATYGMKKTMYRGALCGMSSNMDDADDTFNETHKNFSMNYAGPSNTNYHSAGGTVLGDKSSQKFSTVSSITNIDTANVTIITLRLVARKESQKYIPITGETIHTTKYPSRLPESRYEEIKWELPYETRESRDRMWSTNHHKIN